MHGLTSLVEEFLVASHLRKNGFEKKKILIKELGERNVYGMFEKGTKDLIDKLKELPYRNAFFYKNMYELNLGYYGHVETGRQKVEKEVLKSIFENLDFYYLVQKQKLDLEIKGRGKLLKNKLRLNSIEGARKNLLKEPVFKLNSLIYEAMSKGWSDRIYVDAEFLFKKNFEKMEKSDALIVLRVLLNYLSSLINKGEEGGQSKMLSLYKLGLEKGLLVEKKIMTETAFINIVTVGIFEKEFNWVEEFIEENKLFLAKSGREGTVLFCKSLMYLGKKEYSKVIDSILNFNFSKPLQLITSKTILMRAYFELFTSDNSYYELFVSQTQSFEKFVRRDGVISDEKKEAYLNFILFSRKLANMYLQRSLNQEFYNKIEKTNAVILKSWLLEKIEEHS